VTSDTKSRKHMASQLPEHPPSDFQNTSYFIAGSRNSFPPTPSPHGSNSLFEDLSFHNSGNPNADFIVNMTGNPLTQIGLDYAGNFLANNVQQTNMSSYFFDLKTYFDVTTPFVGDKIKLVLYPFAYKHWSRKKKPGTEIYMTGKDGDIFAPDLYIPLMGFVTYVLLYAFIVGITSTFSPEVLATTSSQLFIILFLEVVLFKSGCFFLIPPNADGPRLFDLIAYCGYIVVGSILSMISGFFGGRIAHISVSLITGFCMCVFMVRTVQMILKESNTYAPASSVSRNYFVAFMGVLQILLCVWLSSS